MGKKKAIRDEREALEALRQAADLYDQAAQLLMRVARGQAQRGDEALQIGAHLDAAADGHKQAKAAVLLAVIETRQSLGELERGGVPKKYTARRTRKRGRS